MAEFVSRYSSSSSSSNIKYQIFFFFFFLFFFFFVFFFHLLPLLLLPLLRLLLRQPLSLSLIVLITFMQFVCIYIHPAYTRQLKGGRGNVMCATILCCAHEGKTDTDKMVGAVTRRNWERLCRPTSTGTGTHVKLSVAFYVHRIIRDGNPGRPPRLSHS